MGEIVDAVCRQCTEGKQQSVVELVSDMMTLSAFEPFDDEWGRSHLHDGNREHKHYKCSSGHEWTETVRPKPCWCGWPENKEYD